MRHPLAPFAVLLPLLAACSVAPTENAPSGAAMLAGVPTGPIPGVTEQPPLRQNPYSTDRIAAADGRIFFVHYNCSGCHGGHAGGGMGPSLRDKSWIYGNSDAKIYDSIVQGRAHGMPAWGTRIPEAQVWKLVAYIKTMRTPDEPEAPESK